MSPRQGLARLLLVFVCLGVGTPAMAGFAAADSYLLSVGRGPGLLGSEWYTTVWVHNPNETDATVRFSFLERNQDNSSPLTSDDVIPAGAVRKYNDVVFTMFGVEEFGAIRVVSDLPLVVASRVYSQPAEGEAASVGQFLPGVPAAFAVGRGETTNLIGVRQHSPPDSWDFRYNYGVVETTGASVTVKISAYHQDNGFLRDKTVTLRPFEAKQWNVSDLVAGGTAWNWRLEVEVIDGPGRVIAFGSGIANGSNDPSTFEMQYDDSLLAGGLTLPFSGSASDDGGAVFDVTNTAAAGTGIIGRGGTSGGSFAAADGSAEATLGLSDTGGTGVWAGGRQEGAYFEDTDGSGKAWIARGDRGIEAIGSDLGAAFWIPDGSLANVATASSGIEAYGPEQGALFGDTDQTSLVVLAGGDAGISATGHEMGGWFAQTELRSEAYVARGGAGISAFGEETGGYFQNTADQSAAHLGHNGRGIEGFGDGGGGYFEDTDEGTWGTVANATASFAGNGAKSFVQNHPHDATRVIVYTAQEGDEVGTYTRGSARLSGGEAWVELGETFQWVTNPDLGLTVHLTPIGSWSQLYVAERSTSRLLVRSAGGDPSAVFDYVVMGLRIGFEEASVVQEKRRDAPIPSMAAAEERYRREPDLREYTALKRFQGMMRDDGKPVSFDLSASEALGNAVGRSSADE